MMIVCNECGNELNDTAKFCKKCGTKVDPQNMKTVDKSETPINEDLNVEQTTTVMNEKKATPVSTLDLDKIEARFFDYFYFLKETIIRPSSVFTAGSTNWLFGAISLIIFSVAFSFEGYIGFWTVFIETVLFQAVITGLLFVLNKFLLGGQDSYFDVIAKYGGLMNTQTLLQLLMLLFGMTTFTGSIIGFTIIVNQLNIFNLYILNSQQKVSHKLDNYYQLLISYLPLLVVLFIIISNKMS